MDMGMHSGVLPSLRMSQAKAVSSIAQTCKRRRSQVGQRQSPRVESEYHGLWTQRLALHQELLQLFVQSSHNEQADQRKPSQTCHYDTSSQPP